MTSWEAFGVAPHPDGDAPEVRPSPRGDFEAPWPSNELTDGVAYVLVQTHGDDPTSAFIEVVGSGQVAVEAAWHRAAAAFVAARPTIWPNSVEASA